MIADDLAAIVERAYALALDPALTDGWLADATRALGGTLGTLSVTEAGGDLVRQAMAFDRPAAIDRYVADGMIAFDPQIAYVRTLDRQTLYLDTDHRRDDDPQTAAFVSYVRSNLALDHHMTTIAPVRGRPLMAGLSINRAVGDGHTPRRERERLAAIARPLADAFSLAVAHADQLASSFWDGLASTAAEPALLIDERGRVMRLTAAAEKLLVSFFHAPFPGLGYVAKNGDGYEYLPALWQAS